MTKSPSAGARRAGSEAATPPNSVKGPAKARGWRREPDAQDLTLWLGRRIRALRESAGWSLSDAAKATGIQPATLSRIENNRMSPTFPLLVKLMRGMNVSWHELMGVQESQLDEQISVSPPEAWPAITVKTNTYSYPHLQSRLSQTLVPAVCELGGRTVEEVGGLTSYRGIEFCYVLSGVLHLHFEDQDTEELSEGQTALFNATIPHAYVAAGRGPVRYLKVLFKDTLPAGSAPPSLDEQAQHTMRELVGALRRRS